jgi:hypothetical protein
VEKALQGLHLRHGLQAWGNGLGRSWPDLPPAVSATLAASVSNLEDRLRIVDALYIPTRSPNSLPDGAPTDHFGRFQSADALRHAVRSLTVSLLRWPEPEQILNQVRLGAAQAAAEHPGLERVALFGSDGRGDAGVGSDLDLLLSDADSSAASQ